MSVHIVTTYTRPNNTISWHEPLILGPELEAKYGPKRTMNVVLIDDTTLVIRTTWDSLDSWEAFMAEPAIKMQYESIKDYHAQAGIVQVDQDVQEV